uniref:Protein kinase domain-containing protein n=1 Tax=Meloidogyne incognita TaxID=6306 RepID=A0A914LX69_MELIC
MKGENININLARKFRPPEIRENFKLSEKIDTWQFGIMLYELQDKRDGAKTPSYSPLTKSPLSSFRTSSPFPSPKYSHKSPSIQGSTGEIIEMASASTINYDKFDNELNNYRLDESKNRLVDRVIKIIV